MHVHELEGPFQRQNQIALLPPPSTDQDRTLHRLCPLKFQYIQKLLRIQRCTPERWLIGPCHRCLNSLDFARVRTRIGSTTTPVPRSRRHSLHRSRSCAATPAPCSRRIRKFGQKHAHFGLRHLRAYNGLWLIPYTFCKFCSQRHF